MIKSFLNLFRSVKKDELVIAPLPLADVDIFFIKLQKPLNNLVSFIKDTCKQLRPKGRSFYFFNYKVIMSETSVETYKTGVDKGVNIL